MKWVAGVTILFVASCAQAGTIKVNGWTYTNTIGIVYEDGGLIVVQTDASHPVGYVEAVIPKGTQYRFTIVEAPSDGVALTFFDEIHDAHGSLNAKSLIGVETYFDGFYGYLGFTLIEPNSQITISAAPSPTAAVPLPTAAWPGLGLLVALGGAAIIRRRMAA